jgi:hypothetical protein
MTTMEIRHQSTGQWPQRKGRDRPAAGKRVSGRRSADHISHTEAVPVAEWRRSHRRRALQEVARRARGLRWSKDLLSLLLEELYVDDSIDEIIGNPLRAPTTRFPQVVAVAIALRHSWRPDDLANVSKRLME